MGKILSNEPAARKNELHVTPNVIAPVQNHLHLHLHPTTQTRPPLRTSQLFTTPFPTSVLASAFNKHSTISTLPLLIRRSTQTLNQPLLFTALRRRRRRRSSTWSYPKRLLPTRGLPTRPPMLPRPPLPPRPPRWIRMTWKRAVHTPKFSMPFTPSTSLVWAPGSFKSCKSCWTVWGVTWIRASNLHAPNSEWVLTYPNSRLPNDFCYAHFFLDPKLISILYFTLPFLMFSSQLSALERRALASHNSISPHSRRAALSFVAIHKVPLSSESWQLLYIFFLFLYRFILV